MELVKPSRSDGPTPTFGLSEGPGPGSGSCTFGPPESYVEILRWAIWKSASQARHGRCPFPCEKPCAVLTAALSNYPKCPNGRSDHRAHKKSNMEDQYLFLFACTPLGCLPNRVPLVLFKHHPKGKPIQTYPSHNKTLKIILRKWTYNNP